MMPPTQHPRQPPIPSHSPIFVFGSHAVRAFRALYFLSSIHLDLSWDPVCFTGRKHFSCLLIKKATWKQSACEQMREEMDEKGGVGVKTG